MPRGMPRDSRPTNMFCEAWIQTASEPELAPAGQTHAVGLRSVRSVRTRRGDVGRSAATRSATKSSRLSSATRRD